MQFAAAASMSYVERHQPHCPFPVLILKMQCIDDCLALLSSHWYRHKTVGFLILP
jgi:hypothetical protein